MNVLPWVSIHAYSGVESLDDVPNVKVRQSFGDRATPRLTLLYSRGWSVRVRVPDSQQVLLCKPISSDTVRCELPSKP